MVAPIEQQINGVENMLYMSSNSTADGRFSIAVTFDLGTNLDIAQVQVQNRVATALPRLPADVRNIGVTVAKSSPDLMMVVHCYSPDQSRDALFISNYATLEIKDALTRVDGVGSITVFGSRDYSMRVWLDPDRLQSLGLTAADVTQALQAQNIQVASGVLNQPPVPQPARVPGRGADARPADRPRGVRQYRRQADRERGGAAQGRRARRARRGRLFSNSYLDRDPAVALAVFQRPGSNALATADKIRATMDEAVQELPGGAQIHHRLRPDPVHPAVGRRGDRDDPRGDPAGRPGRRAVPADLARRDHSDGRDSDLADRHLLPDGVFGFSLNNLSLFGLVLAVGIVVDDAIVVVENVERNIAAGLSPRDAARKSMDEVGGALVAIALVLCAVFIPSAFITGISGQFYRQFALTIAGATVISLIVSLTLSPALCALLLKPHDTEHRERWWERPLRGFFRYFNCGFDRLGRGLWLARRARGALRGDHAAWSMPAIIAFGLNEFRKTPLGFIPQLDRGYLDRRGAIAAGRGADAHRRGASAASSRLALQGAGRRAAR